MQLSKISKSKVWTPLKQRLPNLTSIKLPESLKKFKQIPLDQFIISLAPLPNVEIKHTGGWPLWAGILVGFGFCLLLGATVLILIKYRKFIWYPSCLAIRTGRDLGRNETLDGEMRSVSVQNGLTSTDGGQRTSEPTERPSDEEGRSSLYPRLGIVLKK